MGLAGAIRLHFLLSLSLLLGCAAAWPQQMPPIDKSSTFTSRSELVLVPVVVTKSNKHILSLKKEDFSVREDGKEQRIVVFEEVVGTPARFVRPVPESKNEFTNVVVEPRHGRITILVLDTINTPVLDQVRAREALIKFLDHSVIAGEPVALIGLQRSGVKVIHDFTTDPKVLAAVLGRLHSMEPAISKMSLDETEDLLTDLAKSGANKDELQKMLLTAQFQQNFQDLQQRVAISQTLEGLQHIAHAFAGVPGRKALIWASASFPFAVSDAAALVRGWFADAGLLSVYPLYQRTWKVLNDANIAIYPVDVRGLENPDTSPVVTNARLSGGAAAAQMLRQLEHRLELEHEDTLNTMQTFADITGGRAFFNRNDLDRCFEEATEDAASYYMLGYYRDTKNSKPGWRKLQVKVNASGAQVRARSGYYVGEKMQDPAHTLTSNVALALRSPLDYTAVRMMVRLTGIRQAMSGNNRVSFRITLAPSPGIVDISDRNHVSLEYVGVAKTGDGTDAARFDKKVEGRLRPETAALIGKEGLHYDADMVLPPGEYRVRFVVRDNLRGAMGSVSGSISVPGKR